MLLLSVLNDKIMPNKLFKLEDKREIVFPYPKIAPRQRQSMLRKTRARSTAFERRLFSCSRKAPKRKLTNTLLLRVIETTAMRAPGMESA